MEKHTLSVLVEDKPGVLARVSGLFSRRGFNIDSLAVGPTEHADVSRMTIVVSVEDFPLEQVTKQLNKLVHVLKIVELEPSQSVQRELLLVKVRADATVRSQVLETVELFRAKVVDVSPESLTIEATGTADKIAALLRMLEPYGIREMVQSGHGGGRARAPLHHRRHRPLDSRRETSLCRCLAHDSRPVRTRGTRECQHLLRRRRRPVDHPGPQGRGDRLRQPGPRARAVAARLRRRRADRPAGGLEEPGQGRGGGSARGDAGRGRRRGRPDHDPGAGHQAAAHLRRVDRAQPEGRATRSSSATASTSATA